MTFTNGTISLEIRPVVLAIRASKRLPPGIHSLGNNTVGHQQLHVLVSLHRIVTRPAPFIYFFIRLC